MMFTPLLINSCLQKVRMLPPVGSKMKIVTEVTGVAIGLYIAMGVNCSIYPQFVPINVNKLEPEIRDKALAKGINTLYFNKGM